MKERIIIYPPSMPLALWVLFVAMTLAVYMTSVYEDPYRPQPKTENPAVAQIRPAPLLLPQTSENGFAKKSDTIAPVADQESVMPAATAQQSVTPPAAVKTSVTPVDSVQCLPSRTAMQSPLERVKKSECLYHPIILQAANRHEVDPAIVKAIIMAESSYNPRAVSKRGAKGLMQLMPKTAEEMGVEDIFNPEHNINGGVRYYKKLLEQFKGDIRLALAAYNAGIRKVKEHNGVPPYKSTRYYIKKVFEYYQYYKQQVETDQA